MSQFLKFVFLCDPQGAKNLTSPRRILQGQKAKKQVADPRIILVQDDDSMDELDGEVAMISKKMPEGLSSEGGSGDMLSGEEVK